MNQEKALSILEELTNANGVSGFEDDVLEVIRKHGAPYGEFTEDSLRNLYLTRKENTGNKPVIQLDAHTDEVGFMVQAVTPSGALRFVPLGGWVAANVAAQRVRVRNRKGEYIPGVVASKPPHFMAEEERNRPPRIEDMVIDIGASSQEEALRDFGVGVGAPVVPEAVFTRIADKDLLIAKAFDCRIGCACILAVLEELQGRELPVDIVCGFSVQEEVGLRGAQVTADTIRPAAAIVFEGSPADDTFSEPHMIQTGLHRGPMLRHLDMRMITNPRFLRHTLDLAAEKNIPVQEAVRTGGATNGGPIHISRGSVPVVVVGLPVRYIHSHHSIAAGSDFKNAIRLGVEMVLSLNESVIGGF